jgi:hypothetical protein
MRRATHRTWARLDNASNIFLAARNAVDTKVFRLSADLHEDLDPVQLQRALDATFDRFPLYSSVLRKGLFWYHLQSSDLRPVVEPDALPVCAPLYRPDRPGLLFRVVYFGRRVSLEVFHALSDGTGALWFFQDLLGTYAGLCDPEADPGPDSAARDQTPQTLSADSFSHYFRRRKGRRAAAGPAGHAAAGRVPGTSSAPRTKRPRPRVYRVKGTYTPDLRTHLQELTLPASRVLDLSREQGVSMTMYLVAVFFDAVRTSEGGLGANGRASTLGVSVPVNLRGFFPSTSARNFFAAVQLEHTYGVGPDDVGSVARGLESEFRAQIAPEALEAKLRRFARFERMPGLRIVPRALKDVVLSLINRANNRRITVAISNLGRVALPGPAEEQVGGMSLSVSAVRPQLCVVSHAGRLTLSFTTPFIECGHVREMARFFTRQGIDVRMVATAVTERDLAEAAT